MSRPRRSCREQTDRVLANFARLEHRFWEENDSDKENINARVAKPKSNQIEIREGSNIKGIPITLPCTLGKRKKAVAIPSSPILSESEDEDDTEEGGSSDVEDYFSCSTEENDNEHQDSLKAGEDTSKVSARKNVGQTTGQRGQQDRLESICQRIIRSRYNVEELLQDTQSISRAAEAQFKSEIIENEPVNNRSLARKKFMRNLLPLQKARIVPAKSKEELLSRAIKMIKDESRIRGRSQNWLQRYFFSTKEEIFQSFWATLTVFGHEVLKALLETSQGKEDTLEKCFTAHRLSVHEYQNYVLQKQSDKKAKGNYIGWGHKGELVKFVYTGISEELYSRYVQHLYEIQEYIAGKQRGCHYEAAQGCDSIRYKAVNMEAKQLQRHTNEAIWCALLGSHCFDIGYIACRARYGLPFHTITGVNGTPCFDHASNMNDFNPTLAVSRSRLVCAMITLQKHKVFCPEKCVDDERIMRECHKEYDNTMRLLFMQGNFIATFRVGSDGYWKLVNFKDIHVSEKQAMKLGGGEKDHFQVKLKLVLGKPCIKTDLFITLNEVQRILYGGIKIVVTQEKPDGSLNQNYLRFTRRFFYEGSRYESILNKFLDWFMLDYPDVVAQRKEKAGQVKRYTVPDDTPFTVPINTMLNGGMQIIYTSFGPKRNALYKLTFYQKAKQKQRVDLVLNNFEDLRHRLGFSECERSEVIIFARFNFNSDYPFFDLAGYPLEQKQMLGRIGLEVLSFDNNWIPYQGSQSYGMGFFKRTIFDGLAAFTAAIEVYKSNGGTFREADISPLFFDEEVIDCDDEVDFTKIKEKTISLTPNTDHLRVTNKINGHRCRFTVDQNAISYWFPEGANKGNWRNEHSRVRTFQFKVINWRKFNPYEVRLLGRLKHTDDSYGRWLDVTPSNGWQESVYESLRECLREVTILTCK